VVQLISKNKISFVTIAVLFAVLANFYFLIGATARISPYIPDYRLQAVHDVSSNQAITTNVHRYDYSSIYKPLKLKYLTARIFQPGYLPIHTFLKWVSSTFRNIGLYFLIFYQLARTGSEGSDPDHFYYQD
jgi:hypothetical protein